MDTPYVRSPLWPTIVSAAADAVRLLRERPTKYPPPGTDPYADMQRGFYYGSDGRPGLLW